MHMLPCYMIDPPCILAFKPGSTLKPNIHKFILANPNKAKIIQKQPQTRIEIRD